MKELNCVVYFNWKSSMNKWKVTFLHEGNEYGMMVETQYAKDANDLAKVMVKAIDGIDINPTEEPTKWIESE